MNETNRLKVLLTGNLRGHLSDQPNSHSSPCPAWHLHRSHCYEGHLTEEKRKEKDFTGQSSGWSPTRYSATAALCSHGWPLLYTLYNTAWPLHPPASPLPGCMNEETGARLLALCQRVGCLQGVCTLTRRLVPTVDLSVCATNI